MANKLIDMRKVRKVITLHLQGKSKIFISKYLSFSRNTVKKYIALYQLLNLSIEDIYEKSDTQLEELFSNNKTVNPSPKLRAVYDFFPYMERELKKTGIKHFHKAVLIIGFLMQAISNSFGHNESVNQLFYQVT
jgi:hypothetical protein